MIFYTHWQRITKTIVQQTDGLLYLIDSSIYKNKDTVFDYSTAKTLLFHNQKDFFQKGQQYPHLLPLLLDDSQYLSTLLQQDILDEKTVQGIQETYNIWGKLHKLKKQTHIILIIFTLGIAKLFLP